jgi:CheY-like chemotaxis protein
MDQHARQSSPQARENLEALGKIAGELLHDLANDMTVLQGWALLARGEQEAGRHSGAEIERVLEITSGMGAMLRDTLETIAGQRGSPEARFDPVRLTEQTLGQWVRELAGISVRMQVSVSPETRVAGRSSFWARSLRNLLGNAARHARSEIVVVLREVRVDDRRLLLLRVEDDGPGVPPERWTEMFQPMKRGKDGDLGLGLSSAAWAVAQLDGSVDYVAGGALGGATFEIRVPIATGNAPEAGGALAAASELRGKRIVLTENDPTLRRVHSRLLRRLGCEVLALTVEHDPDSMLISRVEGAAPDIILLDLEDPLRDVLAIWNRMCTECPDLAERVAFIGSDRTDDRGRQIARLTGQPYVPKPLSAASLGSLIRILPYGD